MAEVPQIENPQIRGLMMKSSYSSTCNSFWMRIFLLQINFMSQKVIDPCTINAKSGGFVYLYGLTTTKRNSHGQNLAETKSKRRNKSTLF
jgi:hypothetical protein